MRALVIYESMYGSTHVIADNIADGLLTGRASRPIARLLRRHGYRRGEQDIPACARMRSAN